MDLVVLLQISIAAVFINNIVLSAFLGLCPFFGVSKKLGSAVGMSLAVVFVMTLATLFTWCADRLVLAPHDLLYLRTIVFILVIAALVQLVEITLRAVAPVLHAALGIYLPLMTTNCAVLGVAMLCTQSNPYTGGPYSLLEALVNALASGAGFTMALVLMAGIRDRLELADVPRALRGLPISFIVAGLMALAFLGFAGFRI
jgi:electron transport complex protein RnfA